MKPTTLILQGPMDLAEQAELARKIIDTTEPDCGWCADGVPLVRDRDGWLHHEADGEESTLVAACDAPDHLNR